MFTPPSGSGRMFPNVIVKEPIEVFIQTITHFIEGKIYVRPEERLKEELNQAEAFLAITDAKIYDLHKQQVLYQCEFLALNRRHIIWIFPEEYDSEK